MRILRNILTGALAASLASCSFLDVDPKVMLAEEPYKSEQEALYGLVGVYGVINNEEFYGNYYSLMATNVDDLCYYNRTSTTDYLPVYRFDATTSQIDDIWTEIYQGIKNANAFMNAMASSELECAGAYYTEARFLRAYYHFILAQTWGDVPLRDRTVESPLETQLAATPQLEVLKWAASEMEQCLDGLPEELDNAPSRVVRTTAQGILARVYLFMAGESVTGGDKKEFYRLAMEYASDVITGGKHRLNRDYSQIFKNMMSDKYDREYYESMWEADFLGDRSSADSWSNGRIGDLIGLQSSGASDFSTFKCNFSYAMYNGSLKLWDLYWVEDRTDDEVKGETITDKRQEWNMPPYNYSGKKEDPSGKTDTRPYDWTEGDTRTYCRASIDKTPYTYGSADGKLEGEGNTRLKATAAQAFRNAGKFRREVEYEGVMDAKRLYTCINYPILRYADVLLMYAEAYNEYHGAPTEEVFNYVLEIRNRAGIKTKEYEGNYDTYATFQALVRNERGRELCFESLRKFDLIRWGVFVEEMNRYVYWTSDARWVKNSSLSGLASSIGTSVQPKHVVLPIPSVELGVNKLLQQNPLW